MTERQLPNVRHKYPWDVWSDGEKHTVKRGVDFNISLAGFVGSIHATAQRKGMRAETTTNGDEITFLFIRPEAD